MVVANAVAALAEIGRDDFMNKVQFIQLYFIQKSNQMNSQGSIMIKLDEFYTSIQVILLGEFGIFKLRPLVF